MANPENDLWSYYSQTVRPAEDRRAAEAQRDRQLPYTERALRMLDADPPTGLMSPAVRAPVLAGAAAADAASGLASSAWRGFTTPGAAVRGDIGRPDQMPDEEAVGRALDVAGLGFNTGLASGGMKADPNALGIFAGKRAATADMAALQKAEALERAGGSPSDIWRDTGWGRGADGEWRFEINDRYMTLAPDNKSGKGGFVIDHPDFEAAYPGFLGTITQNIWPTYVGPAFSGQWNRATGTLSAEARSIKDLYDTTVHELQHATQSIERFAPGTNPSSDDVVRRLQQIPKSEIDNAKSEALAYLTKVRQEAGVAYDSRASGHALPAWTDLSASQQNGFLNEALAPDGFLAGKAKEVNYYRDVLHDGWNSPYSKTGLYQREAGETEARNAAARRQLTERDRRLVSPWDTADIPHENLWISYRDAPMSWSVAPKGKAEGGAVSADAFARRRSAAQAAAVEEALAVARQAAAARAVVPEPVAADAAAPALRKPVAPLDADPMSVAQSVPAPVAESPTAAPRDAAQPQTRVARTEGKTDRPAKRAPMKPAKPAPLSPDAVSLLGPDGHLDVNAYLVKQASLAKRATGGRVGLPEARMPVIRDDLSRNPVADALALSKR